MDRKRKSPTPQLLIVSHPDGHLEVYSDDRCHIRLARIADVPGHEATAEDLCELMLPPRWRRLFFPEKRIFTGSTKPLKPSTIANARHAQAVLRGLDELPAQLRTVAALPDGFLGAPLAAGCSEVVS